MTARPHHEIEGSTGYQLAPITNKAALRWIAETHRHLPYLQGALFAAAIKSADQIVGVATAGRGPRVWEGTGKIVISRVAALPGLPMITCRRGNTHAAPVCTMLYRALTNAAADLGYREAWSYTMPGEDGRSLRAAGFWYRGETRDEDWDRPSRSRTAAFPGAKGRWMKPLTREAWRALEIELEAETQKEAA